MYKQVLDPVGNSLTWSCKVVGWSLLLLLILAVLVLLQSTAALSWMVV